MDVVKRKLITFFLTIFAAGLLFSFVPINVFAACNPSAAAVAANDVECSNAGGFWDGNATVCSCPTGSVDLCAQRQFPCAAGFVCSPSTGACVVGISTTPQPTPTPSPTPSVPPGALPPVSAPNAAACPDGFTNTNGVCIPQSGFNKDSLAGQNSLSKLILLVLKYLLIFSGMIAVGALILGGFWYITAGGSEEQSEKGRKAILNAIIGLVVVVLAYAIVTIVTQTLTTTNVTN